jgi:hypothetical protein
MFCAATLLTACSTAQVRMPDGFASHATPYEVSGHSPRRFNEPVRFGPYSALEMREGSTFTWALPLSSVGVGRTSKPYAFTLVAIDQPPVEVQCRVRTWSAGIGSASRRLEVDLTSLVGPMMACGMQLEGEPPMPLELSRGGTRMQGKLSAPWGAEYEVRSIVHMEGTRIANTTPTGYEISGREGIVAVVDVLNAGRVHLDNQLDEEQRVYFAAASAALLMLDPEIDG